MIKRDAWRDYTRIRLTDAQFSSVYTILKRQPWLADSWGFVVNVNMKPFDFQRVNHIELVSHETT